MICLVSTAIRTWCRETSLKRSDDALLLDPARDARPCWVSVLSTVFLFLANRAADLIRKSIQPNWYGSQRSKCPYSLYYIAAYTMWCSTCWEKYCTFPIRSAASIRFIKRILSRLIYLLYIRICIYYKVYLVHNNNETWYKVNWRLNAVKKKKKTCEEKKKKKKSKFLVRNWTVSKWTDERQQKCKDCNNNASV